MRLKLAKLLKNRDGGGETGEETDGRQLSSSSLNWADWDVGMLSPSHEKFYHSFVEIQHLVSRHSKCDFSTWPKPGWHEGYLGKTALGAPPRSEAALSKELKCSWRENRVMGIKQSKTRQNKMWSLLRNWGWEMAAWILNAFQEKNGWGTQWAQPPQQHQSSAQQQNSVCIKDWYQWRTGEPALRIPEGIQKSWLPILVHRCSLSALNTHSSKSPLFNYSFGFCLFLPQRGLGLQRLPDGSVLHTSTSRSKARASQAAIRKGHDPHCCWDVLGLALARCQLPSPRDQAHVDDTTHIDETDNQEQPSWERQRADRRGWRGGDNSHSPQLCIMHWPPASLFWTKHVHLS